jgi:hypothetical protein
VGKSNEYRCPKCQEQKSFAVVAKVWVGMYFDKDGEFEGSDEDHAAVPDHDQEWDNDSQMRCGDCGHSGKMLDFLIERQDAMNETGEERKFIVEVCRIGYGSTEIEVMACNEFQAEEKALDEAGDICFSDHSSEYTAEGCREVN